MLAKADRDVTVARLVHLAEVEARKLHCAKGCSPLFAYCVNRLGFDDAVAYKRVGAARLGRKFPLALELLARGELHVTALMLIGPHLTQENHCDWLTAACRKTRREVEKFVAKRCPKPDVASSVRKLPERKTALGNVIPSPDARRDRPLPSAQRSMGSNVMPSQRTMSPMDSRESSGAQRVSGWVSAKTRGDQIVYERVLDVKYERIPLDSGVRF